ncbi:hypothetical protein [Botrimarina mediterranea]|uniref:hypothetical protein n=1 Tax=Botrimarina mediterranea TaxID=2528022 RepID=UPI001188B02D|nr:hypothetical protein K2D_12830 [Planctomycetes bacterium K2D]
MRPPIREAVQVAILTGLALVVGVYIVERCNLRQSYDVGMAHFWSVYQSVVR